jgi:RNA polymerase sigma-70 factor (ECF subfamily)
VAFDLLCEQVRPTLYGIAYRMLRNSDDANDAVQDTLIRALKALRDFDPERPIRPWLSRICANCCVDIIRTRRGSESLDVHEHALATDDASLDEQTDLAFQQRALVAAVDRLPATYRKIIFMRHFRHMEVNEIADELKKPEGTVKSWLFRARAMLRQDLDLAAVAA